MAIFRDVRGGGVFANLCSHMSWDIALGRWLALCVHPVCAWRARSRRVRAVIVGSYFAGAYVSVLTALSIVQ
jgi:hypothetical protein